ncbi:MAG: Brp/Blh family beta-carotene 15,15'-monooxygenase [Polaribacter sp.]|jgi:Brp/Blh family beta-carotene 15,15'-monooxygenase
MKFTSFLFICGWYLALIFFANPEVIGSNIQLAIAATLIFLVGVPHGAIDHIIFLEENKTTPPLHFYLFYFSLMGGYILAWFYLPVLSFIFFLLLSAFHFGQSQFSDVQNTSKVISRILYFSWGASILSGLIFYQPLELHLIFSESADLQSFTGIFNKEIYSILLPVSTLVCSSILVYWLWKGIISSHKFFMEVLLLLLIHLSFFTLPIVIGFTLYFATLHSTRVLVEEFNYLKRHRKTFNFHAFIQILLPYTLVSAVGGGLLLIASHMNWISISSIFLGLILISILTLPHSIVMDGFYRKMTK